MLAGIYATIHPPRRRPSPPTHRTGAIDGRSSGNTEASQEKGDAAADRHPRHSTSVTNPPRSRR
ncbi:hypothetical protein L226DRAFT_613838 [Lentinus tigrinus ALCF2SS1-7]|uniref:uncharacterized protein n=1 Tax=Lentinus tigrinus ALCF2SS1-7 TaxID=1328758 RepID=UPI001165FC86|nr:hypothetical protein L226DRAFT_613838 [Lentinus tigrinus ALCF2SS1-7]